MPGVHGTELAHLLDLIDANIKIGKQIYVRELSTYVDLHRDELAERMAWFGKVTIPALGWYKGIYRECVLSLEYPQLPEAETGGLMMLNLRRTEFTQRFIP